MGTGVISSIEHDTASVTIVCGREDVLQRMVDFLCQGACRRVTLQNASPNSVFYWFGPDTP